MPRKLSLSLQRKFQGFQSTPPCSVFTTTNLQSTYQHASYNNQTFHPTHGRSIPWPSAALGGHQGPTDLPQLRHVQPRAAHHEAVHVRQRGVGRRVLLVHRAFFGQHKKREVKMLLFSFLVVFMYVSLFF